MIDLDILIPVFHEEKNIVKTIKGLKKNIKINFRIIIVYDNSNDPTIRVIKDNFRSKEIILLKNRYQGFNGAVKTGFKFSKAKAVVLYTAEDHRNFGLLNRMYLLFEKGYDVVCSSRLKRGGDYHKVKEPLIKKLLVIIVSYLVKNLTELNCSDPTNGFRLFSGKIIKNIPIKSNYGFTFAIELLAKAYYQGYKITELASKCPIRNDGESKFKYLSIPFYLPWLIHIFLFQPKVR